MATMARESDWAVERLRAYPAEWRRWQARQALWDPTIWVVRDPAAMVQALVARWHEAAAAERRRLAELLQVAGAVATLSADARQVVQGYDWERLPMERVAARLYISRSTAFRLRAAALAQLRRAWERPVRRGTDDRGQLGLFEEVRRK